MTTTEAVIDQRLANIERAICQLVRILESPQADISDVPEAGMKYPKKIMKLSELTELGYKKEYLMNCYRTKGQRFAQKQNPLKGNSPIIFDTEQFEKWRLKQLIAENKSIKRE